MDVQGSEYKLGALYRSGGQQEIGWVEKSRRHLVEVPDSRGRVAIVRDIQCTLV